MKTRNFRTSTWMEVKFHGNKKHKPKLYDEIFYKKKFIGIVTKILPNGWYEVQTSGNTKAFISKNVL